MAEASAPRRRIAPATLALIAAAVIALVAIVIASTRSGETADSAANAAAPTAPAQGASIEQAIAALRQQLAADPDNADNWSRLGLLYRELGAEREAETAFRRAAELEPNKASHLAYLGEALLVLDPVAGRREAEQLFERAARIEPSNPQIRYYRATLKDIDGDHRGAIDDLLALLKDAPAGASWEAQVRGAIQVIAQRNDIDVAGRLPPPSPASTATAAIPGPTREQMEAARGIPPSQQEEMVKGMVDRLAARLQQNPRDERGWTMLMRSRMVQGDRPGAAAALRSGVAAFQDDAAVQQRLRAAAAELGVPQG